MATPDSGKRAPPGRDKAGIVPPRPLELGDIFGGAFRAVRYAPLTMFGLTLVVLMIAQLLGMGVGWVLAPGIETLPYGIPDPES